MYRVRKGKTNLELNVVRNLKGKKKKKDFYGYVSNKPNKQTQSIRKVMGLLLNDTCDLVPKDREKAEIPSASMVRSAIRIPRALRKVVKSGTVKTFPP